MSGLTEWADAIEIGDPMMRGMRLPLETELLALSLLHLLAEHEWLPKAAAFVGGTCLRVFHGGPRMSEDLDFHAPKASAASYAPPPLNELAHELARRIGADVNVTRPDNPMRSTLFRVSADTVRGDRSVRRPRTKLDLNFEEVPGAELDIAPHPWQAFGVSLPPLCVRRASLEDICTGKMLALVGRARRVKPRDVFDLVWLRSRGAQPKPSVLWSLAAQRGWPDFPNDLLAKTDAIRESAASGDYADEMVRFLPPGSPWRDHLHNLGATAQFCELACLAVRDAVRAMLAWLDEHKPGNDEAHPARQIRPAHP